MILFDLHVCVKGMAHPDNCRDYFWLKENEIKDMVSVSHDVFAKAHDSLKGGKHSDGDISYAWTARGDGNDQPMDKWAKGSFENGLAVRAYHSCSVCGVEGMSRSAALGKCENCSTPIRKFNGFKAEAEKSWMQTELICPTCDLSSQQGTFGLPDTAEEGHKMDSVCPGCKASLPVSFQNGEWTVVEDLSMPEKPMSDATSEPEANLSKFDKVEG